MLRTLQGQGHDCINMGLRTHVNKWFASHPPALSRTVKMSVSAPIPFRETKLWRASSSAVLLVVSVFTKVLIGCLNKPSVHRKEAFLKYVAKRGQKTPLITVSNHYSMVDDFLNSYMLPWKQLRHRPSVRWLPGAKDVCCRTKPSSMFFRLGRIIPIVRGDGVYQEGMDFCADRLSDGEWVHIYAEGKVNTSKHFMRLKWGVGRLVADSKICPVVLPYWALGMDDMFPTQKPYYPRIGHKITVVFGEPMNFEPELAMLREQKKTNEEVRKYITDKIQDVFVALKEETESKHAMFCA